VTVLGSSLLYDTLLVSWVLGVAFYTFALGKLAGAFGRTKRD
jgi:hypothetical protein